MKNKLLFFVLFISLLSYAQQGNVSINWKEKSQLVISNDVFVTIPQFDTANMDYLYDKKQIFYTLSLPAGSAINENSLQITNVVYESVTADQLGDISTAALPSSINAKAGSKKARNDWFTVIKLSPVIKEGNAYKRVKSFSYSLSAGTAAQRTIPMRNGNIISNSVLSSGEWYRFYVEKSGVYKVTKSFLQQLGFNVNVDPRKIKIYGNGGRMLPLLNSTPYPEDLAENAITFIGENDGVFNDSDYILFYAEGVDNWSQENGSHNNLYSDKSYYYVTAQGMDGKRIGQMIQPGGAVTQTVTAFDEYLYHEEDLESIGRLGRKWHGEQFNVSNEQSFEFTVPDIVSGAPASVTVTAAAKSVASTSMAVKVNGAPLGNLGFSPSDDHNAAVDGGNNGNGFTGVFTPSGGLVTVTLTYSNNGVPGSNAWLDYIIVKTKRNLRGNGKQFRFRYNDAAGLSGVAQYQLTNAAGISEVWDITNMYDAVKVINIGNQGQFSFKAPLGQIRQYISVDPADYYTPLREGQSRVANVNLKGTIFNNSQGQFQDIDYIIITPANLKSQADKLANLHRTRSQLNVKVVTLEDIYQEFSSGKQDIAAIRNLVKYVYYNASSVSKRVKYVNLFGDASFDYKDRVPNNTNIVPSMQAYDPSGNIPNYSDIATFVTDDFFVLMDDNEGPMILSDAAFEAVDIAAGRMLVSTAQQADEMVNKVTEYKSEDSYGRWRNEFLMIADDFDSGSNPPNFTEILEGISNDLNLNRPFVNVRKVYADSYVQQASSGGFRYPEAKQQIISAINYGALVVDYLGHGGEGGMAAERIFESSDAQELNNRYKYPLFITATCELTRFDNPYRSTAGEFLYWNPRGGAIALITTTRSIFISAAFRLNQDVVEKLYAFDGGEYPTMAEAFRRSKAAEANTSSLRCVSFIGDPALMLNIPKPKIILTTINGVPAAESTEPLKALSHVKLGGRVTDEAGNTLPGYNGELAVTVFDKKIERMTLSNDAPNNENLKFPFETLGEAIFRGNATVANGQFEFGFVVPRDIRIPVAEGRVSFYSKRNSVLEDHTGYDAAIKVGGINENAAVDVTGPTVRLYMNDESFVNGGITNDSPIFLAFLEDEHGINTASGIGHDIVAILDGDENNPFVLNDYYETELDDYKRGNLSYPLRDLEPGLHTITFKAWDVYNNLVTAEIQFVVVGDEELRLEKVLNYPNPFVSYTEFWFTHNRPFEPLDVQVQVFTVTGKVVKTINQSVSTDGFLCRDIKWDGKDDFGDRIGKGVYIYKLTVRSTTTNKRAEKYEKLVLL